MQYRYVKVANVILQQRPHPGERPPNDSKKANRFLLAVAIAFAISTLILLGTLLSQGKSAQVRTVSGPTANAILKNLQILQLEQQTDGWAEFRSYVPLLSAAIAFGAGAFGAYRYFRDQDRDYILRVEQDISSNLNQVLDFTRENGSQNAHIASALDNLSWLISQVKEPLRQITRVTDAIIMAIKEDIDLGNSSEARFPAICLEHWPDYAEEFKHDGDLQRLLPYRYNEALAKLAKKAPDYFSVVKYDKDKSFIAPEDVNDSIDESDYQFLVALVDGLWQHLDHIADQKIRKEAVADFQRALDNPHLSEQLQERSKTLIGARSS
jgi:hypothetical protein